MKNFFIAVISFLIINFVLLRGEKIIPLEELKKPETIVVDNGQILIAEFPSIYVYNQSTVQFEMKFGRKGDGPQEFSQYIRIQKDLKNPDMIVVGSHMKISYFTRQGQFIKEVRQKTGGRGNVYKPFGDKFVSYSTVQDKKEKVNYRTIVLYDSKLHKIKEVYREKAPFTRGRKINVTRSWGCWFRIFEDKIFITGEEEGVVLVYDSNGEQINRIDWKTEKLPVTDLDKKRYYNHFKTDPNTKNIFEELIKPYIVFPEYFPVIRGMDVVDGKLYVNGYLGKKGMTEFCVFKLNGQRIKSGIFLSLPEANAVNLFPYTIKDNKLYQLVDNDDEEIWELHIHEIK